MSLAARRFSILSAALLLASATAPLLYAQQPLDPARERRIDEMMAKLTLTEKIALIGGESTWFTHPIPRVGLTSMRMSDGPAGLRSGIPAIAYPAPVTLAASWDPVLAQEMGASLGRDARVRDVDTLLAPAVNIYRAPMDGRNFEYLGEDPWLASRIAVGYIEGVQSQGVSATVKHFAMNNQEFNRHNASSDADERTMREIYLPAFEYAVKDAHVGAIMNSYNLVNGIHATQNGGLNITLAKQEWGFDGVIMSDWISVYDGVAAANNGLDLEMPFAHYMSTEVLLSAVKSGQVSVATIDDKVRRILRLMLRFNMIDRKPDDSVSLFSESGDAVALKVAQEGIVLLKNEGHILPLDVDRTCILAVVGPNASPAVMGGGGSAIVDTYKSVSILQGVADFFYSAPSTSACPHRVLYDSGWPERYDVFHPTHFDKGLTQQIFTTRDWTGHAEEIVRPDLNEDRIVTSKTGSIRWTTEFTAPSAGKYFVIVHDGRAADRHNLSVDGQRLPPVTISPNELYYVPLPHPLAKGETVHIQLDYLPNDNEVYPGLGVLSENDILSARARRLASSADAVVIAAGFDKINEHEGMDRTFALPPLQDTMIRNLEALNPHTVLAITAGGNVDMNPWIDRTPALLYLWYPGEEGGVALADILFGVQNPEGKLPDSFAKRWEENPTFNSYYPQDKTPTSQPQIHYTEGVFLGYRYFDSPSVDKANVQPRFPFGFGLSYTTFAFSGLHLSRTTMHADDPLMVTLTVRNTGKVAGAEVAQVYVGENNPALPRPAYELKAFLKVRMQPGESRTLSLPLNRRSFAYWSEQDHNWKVDPGVFTIYAGDSSASLPLHAEVTLQ